MGDTTTFFTCKHCGGLRRQITNNDNLNRFDVVVKVEQLIPTSRPCYHHWYDDSGINYIDLSETEAMAWLQGGE
jgi:hypothetical protein